MKTSLFFALLLSFCHGVQGQQTISTMGNILKKEHICCEWSLGNVLFGSEEMPKNSPIQIISGTFSPSEGIIVSTGNDDIQPSKDSPFRIYRSANKVHVSNSNESEFHCLVYSIKGELLHRNVTRSHFYTIPVPSDNQKILMIRLEQGNYSQTFKVVMP